MEPISIALICTAVFGTVMVVSAFIRQIMISRDKRLNDEAQLKAFAQEVTTLENMRHEMQNKERFQAHYGIIDENKNAVKNVDVQIEAIFKEKTSLIERYSKLTIALSEAILNGESISQERKEECDTLREEINNKMSTYDVQIKEWQKKRSQLLGRKYYVEDKLLEQEKERNSSLDKAFVQHAEILRKTFLRHIENTEAIAAKGIDASTSSFKDLLTTPIHFLMGFFGRGIVPGVSLVHTRVEQVSRQSVARAEAEINDPEPAEKTEAKSINVDLQMPLQRPAASDGTYHVHHAIPSLVSEDIQDTEDTFLPTVS